MPHSFALQVRWADLDVLDHVTNAMYVQYGVDALAALAAERDDPVPTAVGVDVTYRVPLVYGTPGVTVETTEDVGGVGQRIVSSVGVETVEHAVLTLDTGRRPSARPTDVEAVEHEYLLRDSDLDPSAHVSLVGMCRMLQESRAALPETIAPVRGGAPLVVGRVSCRLGQPLGHPPDRMPVRLWVHSMTRSTVVLHAEAVIGESVVGWAVTTLVGLHESGVGARPLSAEERATFGTYLRSPATAV